MKYRRMRLGLGLFLSISVVTACSTDSHRALIDLEQGFVVDEGGNAASDLAKMRKILSDDPSLKPFVEDILRLAEARSAEQKSAWNEAEASYIEALKLDRLSVGKSAFEGWVRIQAKRDPLSAGNSEAIASRLLQLTDSGEKSPYLKRQGLGNQSALSKKIEPMISEIKAVATPASQSKPKLPDPSSFADGTDIFFEARAKAICDKPLDVQWVSWVSSLSLAQRSFWNGLLLQCSGDPRRASAEFDRAMTSLSNEPQDVARIVRAAEKLIQSLKAIGDRTGATEAYASQMEVLRREDLPLDLLGWSPFEKQKRFIDAAYWVSRNRAMQGDYEKAKAAGEEGLEALKRLETLKRNPKDQATITELKVEGLHVIASRILYEQNQFEAAVKMTEDALQTPQITKDWRQRLLWSLAWYDYRKGDKPAAIEQLTRYLGEDLDDSNRTKALYWRGRSYFENGDKEKADEDFDALTNIAPLSFYSVVGIPAVDPKKDWRDLFKKADKSRLSKIDDFNWGVYGEEQESIRRLHRLEFALAGRVSEVYAGLSSELFDSINGKPKLWKELEPSLYATRLMNMAGQYVFAISLSASLSNANPGLWEDYPEQLLVFFPLAYQNEIQTFASANKIDAELVWGLARQESSFRRSVESPVGAIGLMQLMPNTAQELARSLGLGIESMPERLKKANLNVQLGSLYLARLGDRYQGKWPRAIAAYNAGEYVVDTWVSRRDAPDLIVWAEGLSFGETSSYVKNVWRNWEVYRWLAKHR